MSKKSRLRGLFDKQHGKRAQGLLKSASQTLFEIHWRLRIQLSWQKSLLLTCKILGLLVNTFAADERYPVLRRKNLSIAIQMQLSQKQKRLSQFPAAFFKSRLNSKHFTQKDDPHTFSFSRFWTPKMESDKCLKSPVSEDASWSNMINLRKHCRNLNHSTFIIIIRHW